MAQGWKPGKSEKAFRFAKFGRAELARHRIHTYQYQGFGNVSHTPSHDIWGPGLEGTVNLGTSICDNCFAPHKVKVTWPDDAYFQLSYMGKRLWFEDRDHVIGFLTLLSDPRSRVPKYQYWFDRALPTVFKTARARKTLVPKVKKMLRT